MIFDKKIIISLDKNTKREMIGDRLYIRDCVLTSATVNEYLGREIGDSSLESNNAYGILRPLEELEKAIKSYQGIPVLHDHENVDFANPDKSKWMGTTGTNASIKGNDLINDVILWDANLINLVTTNQIKDLSVGYSHQLEYKSGVFDNKKYDFIMKDLIANHLAVVDDGRVERAKLSDSNHVLKEVKKTMGKSGLYHFLSFLTGDKKLMDSKQYAKGILEMASKDSAEFEGGALEQANAIIQMAKKINDSKEEKEDNEKEMEKKDNHKKDNEKEEKEDSEEEIAKKEKEAKEKKEANDKAIAEGIKKGLQERVKVETLCKKVIGNISEAVLMDSTPEELINKTLDSKKIDYESKSYDTKIAILETLATQQVTFNNPQIVNDSKPVSKFINIFDK